MEELNKDNFNKFVFESGLYSKMTIPQDDRLIMIIDDKYSVRSYCPFCKDISIFRFSRRDRAIASPLRTNALNSLGSMNSTIINNNYDTKNLFKNLVFECASDDSHTLSFNFSFDENIIIKVGQYPSIADIQFPQLKKYDNLLKSFSQEFKKSLGLFSHGIGIGSFIYLRRIFEFVIEKVHIQVKTEAGWDEESYKTLKHLEDKIKACEVFFPVFPKELDQHKMQIYSVLSKAVHSLSEEECLELYPTVQYLIERILDFEIQKKEQDLKLQEVLTKVSEVK